MKIEVFKELTNLLNGTLDQKQKTVSQIENKDSGLLAKLFNAIKQNDVTNDEEAKAFLYEEDRKKSDTNKFRNLKSRLQDTLFNSLLIEKKGKKSKHYTDALNECYSKLYLLHVMNKNNARRSKQDLAKETLNLAEKFELTEIALSVSKILKEDAVQDYFENRYEHYRQKTDLLQATLNAEYEAGFYLETFQVRMKNYASFSNDLPQAIEGALTYLKNNSPKKGSFDYNLKMFKIKVLHHQLRDQHEKAITETNKYLSWLNEHPAFYQSSLHGECLIPQAIANFSLNNPQKVVELNDQIEKLLSRDEASWFEWKEQQALMAFQKEEFEEAKGIIHEVYGNEALAQMAPIIQEKWYFYYAIIAFLESLHNPDFSNDFKLYKFLNEVPQLSKDKSGFNAAIFIYEMLFLLVKKEWLKFSERSEALQLYIKRYLGTPNNCRDKLFCRLLVKIEKAGFDYESALEKTLPLLKELRKNPGANNLLKINAEFVSYEFLGIQVLKFLKNNA